MFYPHNGDIHDKNKKYMCTICDRYIFNAMQLEPCNHIFCAECITYFQAELSHICPNCDEQTTQKIRFRALDYEIANNVQRNVGQRPNNEQHIIKKVKRIINKKRSKAVPINQMKPSMNVQLREITKSQNLEDHTPVLEEPFNEREPQSKLSLSTPLPTTPSKKLPPPHVKMPKFAPNEPYKKPPRNLISPLQNVFQKNLEPSKESDSQSKPSNVGKSYAHKLSETQPKGQTLVNAERPPGSDMIYHIAHEPISQTSIRRLMLEVIFADPKMKPIFVVLPENATVCDLDTFLRHSTSQRRFLTDHTKYSILEKELSENLRIGEVLDRNKHLLESFTITCTP